MRRPLRSLVPAALALAALAPTASAQTVGTCAPGAATTDLSAGNVRARLYNSGGLFWGAAGSVYNVPRSPTGSPSAIFAAGLWIGGQSGGSLRVAAADYGGREFWPGPLTASGELPSPANCTAYDRIYRVTRADLDAYAATGATTADLREWPVALGAPVINGDGVAGNYNLAGGDRPEILGSETAWWVMNDVGGAKASTGSLPIGLEVRVSAFSFVREGAVGDATFYRYTLVNRSPRALTDAYVGMWVDSDLGNATDDYVGSDSARGLVYTYNADNTDEGTDGYGNAPPAIGLQFLDGPLVAAPGRTWVDPDGTEYPDQRRLTMTAATSPQKVAGSEYGTPRAGVGTDWYNVLVGRWRGGAIMRTCGDGGATSQITCAPTNWIFSGDPVLLQGWSERNLFPSRTPLVVNSPNDRRMVGSMGPFTLGASATQTLTAAFVYARGGNNISSVSSLQRASDLVRLLGGALVTSAESEAAPVGLALDAPRPNPARGGAVTLRLGMGESGGVARVEVVDLLGRRMALVSDGALAPGWTDVTVETASLPAGVYVVRLTAGAEMRTQRLVVTR